MSTSPRTQQAMRVLPVIALSVALLAGCASEPGTQSEPENSPSAQAEPRATESQDQQPPAEEPAEPEIRADLVGLSQEDLNQRIIAAAWENNVAEATALITAGADVNALDETVQSAHLIAASEGYAELLRLTLEHGADVAVLDSYHGTGLIRAAERGHTEVVAELISAGTPLDYVNRVGYFALHEALIYAKPDQVENYRETALVLIAAGANVTTATVTEGATPRQLAAWGGLWAQEALIARAIEAPIAASDAPQALLRAAAAGDPDTVALALRAGADPNARDAEGRSALELARSGNHGVSERVLLWSGATA